MKDWTITKEAFDRLLLWLNPDPECAAETYERLRRKLILLFASRGKAFPEEMADDCFNRVMRKLPEIEAEYKGSPDAYFFGVARIVILEWDRKNRPIEIPPIEGISQETEEYLACLDLCLDKLPDQSREVVTEYYQEEKRAKIDHRAALARRLNITANALRIRAHHIREQLERCVLECLSQRAFA